LEGRKRTNGANHLRRFFLKKKKNHWLRSRYFELSTYNLKFNLQRPVHAADLEPRLAHRNTQQTILAMNRIVDIIMLPLLILAFALATHAVNRRLTPDAGAIEVRCRSDFLPFTTTPSPTLLIHV
jgi:hypothetical protein